MKNTIKKNTEGYGYKYTELADINRYIESIGETYIQEIEPHTNGNDYITTTRLKDGKQIAKYRGCKIPTATLSGKSNPAQEYGSALTYARRYSLLMAYGLATTDNDAEDLTVDENVELIVNTNGKDNVLKKTLDEEIGNDYKLQEISNNKTKITFNKKYGSIEDYLSSSVLYNEVFYNKEYDNDLKTITLGTNAKIWNKGMTNNFNIEDIKVSVTSPLKMLSSNADEIDGNKYIWNLNDSSTSKDIFLQYSLLKNKINYKSLILLIFLIIALITSIIYYDKYKKKNYL